MNKVPCTPVRCSLPQLCKSVCDLPSCEISDYSINSPFHLAGCMVAQLPPYSELGMEKGDGEGVRETASCGASVNRVSQAMGAGHVRWGLRAIITRPKEST